MSLANISIVGNLVKSPEQMHFVSGKVKTTFTVAVNGFGRPARGGDTADFYRVETWGKLAELAGKYLDKGNQIAVSGRLLFDRFVDQQGKNRVVPIVEANQLSLPPKPRSNSNYAGERIEEASANETMTGAPIGGQIIADDQMDSIKEIFADAEDETNSDFNLVETQNKAKAKHNKLERIAMSQ